MFACKACGAALRFDIATQKMLCPYCDSQYDPLEIKDTGKAEEAKVFDITIFTCPMCGGELGGTETSAAEFCSYCGAPTILESRMARIEKPKYIIPFKKTKEDCGDALKSKLKKSVFLPGDFKKCEVEKIRGIYMPCWSYNVVQDNVATVNVEQPTPGAKDCIDKFRVSAHVKARYEGIPHDASEAYADRISEALEPYNYKERKPFTPSYIAGFFSDIQDVEREKYKKEAIDFADQQTFKEFVSQVPVGNGEIVNKNGLNKTKLFDSQVERVDNTLIPVWFLAYRSRKRVAYATVNGETGKVVSDLPVSIGKVLLTAFILAIPLFIMLNMFVSMRARSLSMVASAMVLIVGIIYCIQLSRIKTREANINFEKAKKQASEEGKEIKDKKKKIPFKTIGCGIVLFIPAMGLVMTILSMMYGFIASVFTALMPILIIVVPVFGLKAYKKRDTHMSNIGFVFLLVAGLLNNYMYFKEPVSDINYYASVIAALAAILWVMVSVIKTTNILTTRPLPQFKKRGGEEYE